MAADHTVIETGIWTDPAVWDVPPVLSTPPATFGVAEGKVVYIPTLDCLVDESFNTITWSNEDILGRIVVANDLAGFLMTSLVFGEDGIDPPRLSAIENVAVPPEDVRLGEPCGSDFYPALGELEVGAPIVSPPLGTNRFDTYKGKAGNKYISSVCLPLFYTESDQIPENGGDRRLHLFTIAKIPSNVRIANMSLYLDIAQTFTEPIYLHMRTERMYYRHRKTTGVSPTPVYSMIAATDAYPILPVTFPFTYNFSPANPYCISNVYSGTANLAAYLVFTAGEEIESNKAIYGYIKWEYWS